MNGVRISFPSHEAIREVTGMRRRYIGPMIKVMRWLAAGAPKNKFPGVSEEVNFSMSRYIDNVSHSACIAGAIHLAYKGRYPKNEQTLLDMDRHFRLEDETEMDRLFYSVPPNYDAKKAFWVLFGFAVSGKTDTDFSKIDPDIHVEISE